jgi:alpha-L-fucosidase
VAEDQRRGDLRDAQLDEFAEGNSRGSRAANIRFTVKGDDLFAIILGNWPGASVTVKSLPKSAGAVAAVSMLGADGPLQFTQDEAGLTVTLPPSPPCKYAYTLRISGLKMNPPTATESGNPQ